MRIALLSFVLVLSACGETKAVTGNDEVESTTGGDSSGDDDGGSGDTIDGLGGLRKKRFALRQSHTRRVS